MMNKVRKCGSWEQQVQKLSQERERERERERRIGQATEAIPGRAPAFLHQGHSSHSIKDGSMEVEVTITRLPSFSFIFDFKWWT
jgi:hypothetical protein